MVHHASESGCELSPIRVRGFGRALTPSVIDCVRASRRSAIKSRACCWNWRGDGMDRARAPGADSRRITPSPRHGCQPEAIAMQRMLSALVRIGTRAAVGPPLSRLCSTIQAGGDGSSAQGGSIDNRRCRSLERPVGSLALRRTYPPTAMAAVHRSAASLSRIGQLDQRTALPDQCLHPAEADVRPRGGNVPQMPSRPEARNRTFS